MSELEELIIEEDKQTANSTAGKSDLAEQNVKSADSFINSYYKDEIQSETLTIHRKKFKKSDLKEDEPETKKRGFRITSKPSDTDTGGDSLTNYDIASLSINGLDYATDKLTEWVSDYRYDDTPELKDKRKAIAECAAKVLKKWNVEFTEEFVLGVLLCTYASAKSRHLVKKTNVKKPIENSGGKVLNLKEAIREKEERVKGGLAHLM